MNIAKWFDITADMLSEMDGAIYTGGVLTHDLSGPVGTAVIAFPSLPGNIITLGIVAKLRDSISFRLVDQTGNRYWYDGADWSNTTGMWNAWDEFVAAMPSWTTPFSIEIRMIGSVYSVPYIQSVGFIIDVPNGLPMYVVDQLLASFTNALHIEDKQYHTLTVASSSYSKAQLFGHPTVQLITSVSLDSGTPVFDHEDDEWIYFTSQLDVGTRIAISFTATVDFINQPMEWYDASNHMPIVKVDTFALSFHSASASRQIYWANASSSIHVVHDAKTMMADLTIVFSARNKKQVDLYMAAVSNISELQCSIARADAVVEKLTAKKIEGTGKGYVCTHRMKIWPIHMWGKMSDSNEIRKVQWNVSPS